MPPTIINPITGRKRRKPFRDIPRRVRSKGLNVHQALMLGLVQSYRMGYTVIMEKLFSLFTVLFAAHHAEYVLHGLTPFYDALHTSMRVLYNDAIRVTYFQYVFLEQLDFAIGDMTVAEENAAVFKRRKRFGRIESIHNDDEARSFTNFTKSQLRRLNFEFGLPKEVWVHTYRFHREEILIYFLIKNKTGMTHAMMTDTVTHGCPSQMYFLYR